MDYQVSRATPDDAEAYVACHLDCLEQTYGATMPPAFVEQHRAEAPQLVTQARRLLAAPGFVPDGGEMSCGPTFFHRRMYWMVRGTTR